MSKSKIDRLASVSHLITVHPAGHSVGAGKQLVANLLRTLRRNEGGNREILEPTVPIHGGCSQP